MVITDRTTLLTSPKKITTRKATMTKTAIVDCLVHITRSFIKTEIVTMIKTCEEAIIIHLPNEPLCNHRHVCH
ncbi:hypothetical protein BH23BAC3_BH23BAC3_34890 [soil metagenome]